MKARQAAWQGRSDSAFAAGQDLPLFEAVELAMAVAEEIQASPERRRRRARPMG